MKRDLVMQALHRAFALRKPPKGVIHRSDRGSQYCSRDYRKLLKKYGFEASTSGRKGLGFRTPAEGSWENLQNCT